MPVYQRGMSYKMHPTKWVQQQFSQGMQRMYPNSLISLAMERPNASTNNPRCKYRPLAQARCQTQKLKRKKISNNLNTDKLSCSQSWTPGIITAINARFANYSSARSPRWNTQPLRLHNRCLRDLGEEFPREETESRKWSTHNTRKLGTYKKRLLTPVQPATLILGECC